MASTPNPISFRLPPEVFELLERSATEAGTTSNRVAQRLVIDALTQPNHGVDRADLERIHHEIKKLREDFATALMAQIVHFNRLLPKAQRVPPEEFEQWVRRALRP